MRPEFCAGCPISKVTEGYVPLHSVGGKVLVVGEAAGEEEAKTGKPFVGGAGAWLNSMLRAAKIGRGELDIVNCVGCRPPANVFPSEPKFREAAIAWASKGLAEAKKRRREEERVWEERLEAAKGLSPSAGREATEYCYRNHLLPVVLSAPSTYSHIIALGDKALQALTGKRGILLWRGSPLPLRVRREERPGKEWRELTAGTWITERPFVIPTLHPAYLMRNANLFSVAVQDLRKRPVVPEEEYVLWGTLEDLKRFRAKEFAFDLEWDAKGNITLCGLCERFDSALVVTWVEPNVSELKRIFEEAEVLIGHNIVGADLPYFDRLGWKIKAKLVDTMLMQHLVQPDMRHGLGFVASVFSNKVFWKGDGEEQEDENGEYMPVGAQWKTWDHPEALPREMGGYGGCVSEYEAFRLYNARDTDATFQCSFPLRTLLKKYELEEVYELVSVPVAKICQRMGERGLRVEAGKLKEIREGLVREIEELEKKLPEGLRPYNVERVVLEEAPPGMWGEKVRVCKGKGKEKHEGVEVKFTRPGSLPCPKCGRLVESGKMKEVRRVKKVVEERVVPWNSSQQVLEYAAKVGCREIAHPKTGSKTANKLARKIWSRERPEFVLVDELKKRATLVQSFAKEGLVRTDRMYFNLLVHGTAEGRLSSSGKRRGVDLNVQNIPKSVRKVFVPDEEGWMWVTADIVQGENMLTCWLAKDWERWERLNTPGFDEHSYMAAQFFNRPVEAVSKGGPEEHLRKPGKIINHGMNYGLGAVKTQLYLEEQGFSCTLKDVKEMIEIWKKVNRRTAEWQQETIATVERQGFLRNPFGRVRFFQSRDFATKALAFLPASTLADMVLRMMIGLYPWENWEEVQRLGIVSAELPEGWDLRIQVHDELALQGPKERWKEAARALREVMTQKWRELDGFGFKIELKASERSWGECAVVKEEE